MSGRVVETINVGNTLGEGVVFRGSDATVWWIDIPEAALFRLAWPSLDITRFTVPERPGAIALIDGRDDALLLALETQLAVFYSDGESCEPLLRLSDSRAGVRSNDGRVDAQGRFHFGRLAEDPELRSAGVAGTILALDGEAVVERVRGLGAPNGIAFHPETATLFYSDSVAGRVYRAADAEGEPVIIASDLPGKPDGAVFSRTGILLSALWDSGQVVAIDSQTGGVVEAYEIPAARPTCPALADDLGLMFVTSARDGAGHGGDLYVLETEHQSAPAARARIPGVSP